MQIFTKNVLSFKMKDIYLNIEIKNVDLKIFIN